MSIIKLPSFNLIAIIVPAVSGDVGDLTFSLGVCWAHCKVCVCTLCSIVQYHLYICALSTILRTRYGSWRPLLKLHSVHEFGPFFLFVVVSVSQPLAVLIVCIQDKSTDRRSLPLPPTFPCHRSHLPSTETLDIFGTLSLTPIEGSPRRPYFGKLLSI